MTAETGAKQRDGQSTELFAFHKPRPVAAKAAQRPAGSPGDPEGTHRVAVAAAASPHRGQGWTCGRGQGRAVSPTAEPQAAACLFSMGVSFSFFSPLSSLYLEAVFQMSLC